MRADVGEETLVPLPVACFDGRWPGQSSDARISSLLASRGASMCRFIRLWGIALVALMGCQTVPSPEFGNSRGMTERSEDAAVERIGLVDAPRSNETQNTGSSREGRVLDRDVPNLSQPPAIRPASFDAEAGTTDGEQLPPPMPAPSQVNDEEGLLTLGELESMALSQNPAVAEAAARVQAMQGKYVQVGLPPNPTAGYTAGEIGNDGAAGQQGAFLGQEFVTGGKLRLNREAAAWEVQRAEQELAALRQRVATDVRVGYYELLIAQERLAMTERLAEVGQRAVDAVGELLKAKEASGTDLLQAKVEADTARMLVENASVTRLGAWQRLAAVLGDPDLPMSEVAGNAAQDLPTIEFESSLARILSGSPQLSAQYAEIERARWSVNRARAEVIPNVTVQGSVQYDDATDFTIAGVQVGLPIPIINRNQGGIQQARGELVAAEQSANRLALALQRRLASVFQQYQTSRQQVDRYSEDILPNVDETLRLTTEGYRAGEFNFLQLLTVQRTFFQTHLAYLDALRQMWSASQQIEGLLLSESLESDATSQ